jgi:hypothetical protein
MKILVLDSPKPAGSAWGGGNAHFSRLCRYLIEHNHALISTSNVTEGDVIYARDIRLAIISGILPKAKAAGIPVVLRIGDLGTHSKPEIMDMLIDTINNELISLCILPSRWAQERLMTSYGPSRTWPDSVKYQVIPNAADDTYFKIKKLKVVSHHWSDNPKKGAEVYTWLDKNAEDIGIDFTFIGRPCWKIKGSTKIIRPLSKTELAIELPKHDWYLTASEDEAGANHVLEALNLGMPIIYHPNGGSIPEYISRRGICYRTLEDLRAILCRPTSMQDVLSQYEQKISEVVHGTD